MSLSESLVMHVRIRWRRSRDVVADDGCFGAINGGERKCSNVIFILDVFYDGGCGGGCGRAWLSGGI